MAEDTEPFDAIVIGGHPTLSEALQSAVAEFG
jgi:hypothetical protein